MTAMQRQPQVRAMSADSAPKASWVPTATHAPGPALGHDDEEAEVAVFVLRYEDEIAFLKNEGIVRTGMLPSGFKVR
jgi:hypothetical protein